MGAIKLKSNIAKMARGLTNFIDIYVYSQGKSETPTVWHRWAGISLIAACLQDRVYHVKYRDEPLSPNLYVLLLGPTGAGKGRAIKPVRKLVEPVKSIINPFYGRATMRYLTNYMGQRFDKDESGRISHPKIWILMEELANDIGGRLRSEDFIRGMTEMYHSPSDYTDGTGMFGGVLVDKPLINCLWGSTPAWYVDVVRRENIYSGFQPRINTVWAQKDYSIRIPNPEYPEDYQQVMEWLQECVYYLVQLEGEMLADETWESSHEQWYRNRHVPRDDFEGAVWNQEDAHLRKLSMIVAVSEDPVKLWRDKRMEMTHLHLGKARRLMTELKFDYPKLIEYAHQGMEGQDTEIVRHLIDRFHMVPHKELMRMVIKRGITVEKFAKIRRQLWEEGRIGVYWKDDKQEMVEMAPDATRRVDRLHYATTERGT